MKHRRFMDDDKKPQAERTLSVYLPSTVPDPERRSRPLLRPKAAVGRMEGVFAQMAE
jgi:hypothetical protein